DWDKVKVAAGYMQEAYYCYSRWGAKAKVADLETRYPELLRPILKPLASSDDVLTTLMTIAEPTTSIHASHRNSFGNTSLNQTFDFASILKASQALSGTIQLNELLRQLTQIILQNSGGDRCALILLDAIGEWQVRAISTSEEAQLCNEPLHNHSNLPVRLIQYVKNIQTVIVIDDLDTNLPVIDDYLRQQQPKSVLCLPILNHNRCVGIVSLENSLTSHVFTNERILVLNFLCTQAAISLENSRLYESVALKSSAMESAVDGMAILEDGKYIYLNATHASLLGYELHELMGQSWEKLYSPMELERLKTIAFPTLEQTGQWSGESIALRKDGNTFAQELSLSLLENGKLIYICRDISDRKIAEEQLRLSEQRYATLAAVVPVGIFRTDTNGHCTYVNNRWCQIAGLTPEAASGYGWQQGLHPDDQDLITAEWYESVQENRPFQLEYRFQRSDGQVTWVFGQSVAERDSNGHIIGYVGTITDISDRKAAEQKLLESQTFLKTVLDTFPLSVFWKDCESRYIGVNRNFAQDAGFKKAEQIAGLNDFDMPWAETEAEDYRADDQEVMRLNTSKLGIIETQIQADGNQIWVEINKLPLHDLDGNVIGVLGTYQDISDRKRAEAAVLQKSQDLEKALTELQNAQLKLVQSEKMSALGGLVAGVAHEINNPTSCIVGNVDVAQDYFSDLLRLLDSYAKQFPQPGADIENELEAIDLEYVREDLPKLIRAMKGAGDRIQAISTSLRTFSRIGKATKQPFDIRESLESTLLILRHRLKANEHRPAIEVEADYGDIPEIPCFPGQLNQVFMNILANAIDMFDEMAQQTTFNALEKTPQKVTIRTIHLAENNTVEIWIIDNGKGMLDEVKSRIFDHLFTTKGVGKGTGLGLAIAHQIVVDTHRGSLEVHSEVSQGTEFCIRLPFS
ncbi:MAG: PAS domain S-box protein, partial [Leptolyngbya sp. SIO1D8]|nr:PAS domain S-box protein [Leptolyngbya sp. SIO1D8]